MYRFTLCCLYATLLITIATPYEWLPANVSFPLFMAALCTLAIVEIPSIVRNWNHDERE